MQHLEEFSNNLHTENENERRILEAAEKEFLRKGFGGARTTEIARQAGLTHAMLHYYFRTKENLFEKVFERKSELLAETLTLTINPDLPFRERIKQGIEKHFDLIAQNRELPLFVINEVFKDKHLFETLAVIVQKKIATSLTTLAKDIRDESAKGNIRFIAPFDLVYSILSLNVFVFISLPAVGSVINPEGNMDIESWLEHRKKENVEIILNRLRP